jgi:hypothetical protein
MHKQPYIIQYLSTYPNCGASQRPIVANNNLVKREFVDSKHGEKNMKQDSRYLQPKWCPSGLTHTQKRKLQRLRKQESVEHQSETKPARSTSIRKEWRPKKINLASTSAKSSCMANAWFHRP